ncbi:chorismate mutase [Streptococcus ovuberis]|uniref:Chorismate mutase n=1 Tax=Streptococcus ovuberis TaxID=1936207 RepID=A0A7X6MYU2_9STRE|nr:chorismate mutase [Streptococcus ovuberis]NKZ20895.1 chorismate mutase [Streptococcus ovuberis]
MTNHLDDVRKNIDQIDRDLVSLLEQRMTFVRQVIAYKQQERLPILDQERELAVLDKVEQLVQQDDYRETIIKTFSDIMRHSRDYQAQQLRAKDL